MHAKSLAVLENLMLRRKMVESAKESITKKASNFEIYGKSQAVFIEMDSSTSTFVGKELKDLKDVVLKGEDKGDYKDTFDPEKHIDAYLHVRVNEQRVVGGGSCSLCGVNTDRKHSLPLLVHSSKLYISWIVLE
ncbi:boron transporter 4-like [Cajanus cajan]|uniref:boron transporter 4-like n=1 Tax=Cajanus cajan TaxID=3821 RepID=UPI0010FBB1FA|nr:boron transporter 4-like [Cajanus cajan]